MEPAGRLRIKDWAVEDRPREKLQLRGVTSLTDAELLAILIGSGNSEETAVHLAQRILSMASNNLNALGKVDIKDLTAFKGIGEAKAITIAASLELGRRRGISDPVTRETVLSSRQAFELFHPLVCDLPYEELWIALTNRAGKVIEKVKISQGGTSETTADLRLILKPAINSLCSGILLCHNHPSGNIQPSSQDDSLTFRLEKAASYMSIKLMDHIIVCDNTYYSYADEGRLK